MANVKELLEQSAHGVQVVLGIEDVNELASIIADRLTANVIEAINNKEGERLLTCDEVQGMLGIGRTTLYRWERSGYLMPVRIGAKVRYRIADVEQIKERRL